MPEYKHLAGLTKLFTDFEKVSFDQKDFPITLLDQIYTLSTYSEFKHMDLKKRLASEVKKIKEEFR